MRAALAMARWLLCRRNWHISREIQTLKYRHMHCYLCARNVTTLRSD